jgi:hypothetical protein
MELRYRGIFSWGENAGIYQRLAVGDIAVTQPGAALMFSKNDKGELDPNVSRYIATAKDEITIENHRIDKIITYVTNGNDVINATTLNTLVSAAKSTNPMIITTTVSSAIKGTTKGSELKGLLFDLVDNAISPLYKSLPADKQ